MFLLIRPYDISCWWEACYQDKTHNTHSIGIHICKGFWEPRIKFSCLISSNTNFIREHSGISIATSPKFFSENSYLLQATEHTVRWWIECIIMNRGIHLMGEVSGTVYVYRAECSLSDVYWYFFPNNSPETLLNICIINGEKKARNSRISNQKRSIKFRKTDLNIIQKFILARDWKFGIKKRRMFWKLPSCPCLSLATKTRGRTADVCWLCSIFKGISQTKI